MQFVNRIDFRAPASLSALLSRSLCRCYTSSSGVVRVPTESPVLAALQAKSSALTRVAIRDSLGTHTVGQLLERAEALSSRLDPDAPIAVFLPPDSTFVIGLLAAWRLSLPAVPLSPLYPATALAPLVQMVNPSCIVTSRALRHALPSTVLPIIALDGEEYRLDFGSTSTSGELPSIPPEPTRNGLVFFTSGTTGAPKGVVWTHDMIAYQLQTLSSVWRWTAEDRILNVLPLHHIHGLVNVVLCALYNGAHLEMHSAFDAHSVWSAITREDEGERPTIFMAVPAVYHRLINYYDAAPTTEQRRMRAAAAKMRLFVSGSAALPRADFNAWLEITGHRILERYGMTETGLTLSNHYDDRRCGMLGAPLPGVSIRLSDNPDGELLVKSPGVFPGYWNNPERTRQCFTDDGYFMTGDIVELDSDSGYFRLLGRANSDFVNTGGYKVSTIEVENVIREIPGVEDCCVLGFPDASLGERVVAVIVASKNVSDEFISSIRARAEEILPRYKVPRKFYVVESLPRNVLGKVQKPVLRSRLQS